MSTAWLFVFTIHALASTRYASQSILIALTVVFLTTGLFAIAASLVLVLVFVDLSLECINVSAEYFFYGLFPLISVLVVVVAVSLKLLALTRRATESSVSKTNAI